VKSSPTLDGWVNDHTLFTLGAQGEMRIEDWGLIPYEEALKRQLELVEQVRTGESKDALVFCTHPPVVTIGRATQTGDVDGWVGDVIEVSRGGRATYHGPSQLVIYPIWDLNKRGRDLRLHLRTLEQMVINLCQELGVKAVRVPGQTGVWTESGRKLASVGVAVKSWVSYHGISLNVFQDNEAYRGIKPCGFTSETMISLEEVLNRKFSLDEAKDLIQANLLSLT
jgi:lipoyl(octanoyl) transferase